MFPISKHSLSCAAGILLHPLSCGFLLSLPCAAPPGPFQDYKKRNIQLILTNPSPRVVRLMERSGLINKIGRDWIFVRVHDAVRIACNSVQVCLPCCGRYLHSTRTEQSRVGW